MTHRDDELIAAFLADGPNHGRPAALDAAFASVRSARQRPAWLARATAGTFDNDRGTLLRMAPMLAAVALVGVIAGALVVANQPPRPAPTPIVLPTASADASQPQPSASASTAAEPRGLVAYSVIERLEPGQADCEADLLPRFDFLCNVNRIWISNADGTDAHALHPDQVRDEAFISWTSDGSRLFYTDPDGLALAEPDGTVVQRWPDDTCPSGCQYLGGTLSPDGTRIADATWIDEEESDSSVISIVDLVTGQVIELEETRTTNAKLGTCHDRTDCPGMNQAPVWSPDGTTLAFTRDNMSPERDDAWVSSAVFVVNTDGTDLRRVTPVGWSAVGPTWSADGTRLLITHVQEFVTPDGLSTTPALLDVYSIRPDGSDLVELTDDGHSLAPAWTTDGRVTFTRLVITGEAEAYENWIVDADGTNPSRLPEDLAALSAAGCISCIYPFPASPDLASRAHWQP